MTDVFVDVNGLADCPTITTARLHKALDRIGGHYGIILVVNDMRDCPPQMRSPATNSQGFTGLPLPWLRHVTVTRAGLLLPASGLCCRQVSSIAPPSVHDFTLRLTLPFGDSGGATRVTPSVVCHDSPVRDNPQTLSRVVAAGSLQVHPQLGARTTAKHQCSNRIISR